MKKLANNESIIKNGTGTVECISTNRGPYICPHCNMSFTEFKNFNCHLKDQCTTARKVYITYPSTNDQTGGKVLHLTVDQYFYGTCAGKKHKEKKTGSKFTCYSCQKVLRNNIRFMSHVRHKIENSWEENDNINDFNICNHCYRHYDSPFHLQCHLETVHTTVPAASTCRICELNFESEDTLLDHMQSQHVCNEMPYICKLCMYRSSFYCDLMTHFRQVHENGKSMMCPFCLCIMQTPNSYLKHVLQHRKKNLRCSKCRLQFIHATDKSKHLKADHMSVRVAIGKSCLPKKPNQYKINVEVAHHPLSPTKQKATNFTPNSRCETTFLPSTKRPAQSHASPNNLFSRLQPKVKECNIYIRLTRDCENSKCYECGAELGFYAHNYNRHYCREYSCQLCSFVSHCPNSTNRHIRRFHLKRRSSRSDTPSNSHASKDGYTALEKLCKRTTRSTTPSPSIAETKKDSVRKRPVETSPSTEKVPPKKQRSKLNLDSMLEKAAQQVALENIKYLNKHPMKQPRKQLLPKKVSVDSDAREEKNDSEDCLSVLNLEMSSQNAKPKKKKSLTTGSSAVQAPSPFLKVGRSLAKPATPPDSPSPPHSNNHTPCLSPNEDSAEFPTNKQFTNALGLKELVGSFPKKTAPPSMFNPYKFSSTKAKRLLPLHTPKHKEPIPRPTICTKPPLPAGPDLVQPPLPDLCFVKNKNGKILLSTKEHGKNALGSEDPQPPTFMWFSDVTNSSFTAHWIPPMNCTVTHYNLIFKGIGLPTKQVLPPEQTSVRLVGLRSSTEYSVRVSSRCKTLESAHIEGKQTTRSLRADKRPMKFGEVINLDDDDDDDCQIIETPKPAVDSTSNVMSELHGTAIPNDESSPNPESPQGDFKAQDPIARPTSPTASCDVDKSSPVKTSSPVVDVDLTGACDQAANVLGADESASQAPSEQSSDRTASSEASCESLAVKDASIPSCDAGSADAQTDTTDAATPAETDKGPAEIGGAESTLHESDEAVAALRERADPENHSEPNAGVPETVDRCQTERALFDGDMEIGDDSGLPDLADPSQLFTPAVQESASGGDSINKVDVDERLQALDEFLSALCDDD